MRRMRTCLPILGKGVAVALAMALVPVSARATQVNEVRVWADASHTRLVFDLTDKPDYRLDREHDAVVLEMAGGELAADFTDPAAQGLYRGMSHRLHDGRLRITAQMAAASKARSFVLAPSGKNGHYRLVLDLLPGHGQTAAVAANTPADKPEAAPAARPAPPAGEVTTRHHGSRSVGASRQVTAQAAALLNGQRKVVVCIDAGHGGKDTGAIGPDGTDEKNVTLAVARDLAAEINRQPGMQAILTRDDDTFIPLAQRYRIAREHDADLFVSIHADSYSSGDARGSSVWVLSSRGKTSVAARLLADRENSADLIGGVSLAEQSDGLAKVLLDMQQGWAVQASDMVAGNVLKALGRIGPTHRGYVERANFVVLRSPDVPSILVETAFISNPSEERKLRDPEHQQALAGAVMSGVKGYFESTPPPGTWFAAQATRHRGSELAVADEPPVARIAVPAATDAPADSKVRDLHRVSSGESLGSIAKLYGVSVGSLKTANQLSGNRVRAGAVLAIPAS